MLVFIYIYIGKMLKFKIKILIKFLLYNPSQSAIYSLQFIDFMTNINVKRGNELPIGAFWIDDDVINQARIIYWHVIYFSLTLYHDQETILGKVSVIPLPNVPMFHTSCINIFSYFYKTKNKVRKNLTLNF